MGYIYKITNTVSGKCYIGETMEETPEIRWKGHIKSINHNRGCPALKSAIKKYGIKKFKFEIVIICFDEDRFIYEKEYIKKYNSQVPHGYNILPGGIGGAGFRGKNHTAESKSKIAEGLKKFQEKNPNHFNTYKEKHKKSMENVDTSSAVKKSEKFRKAVNEGRVGARAHKNSIKISNSSIDTNIDIRNILAGYNNKYNILYRKLEILSKQLDTLTTILKSDYSNNILQNYYTVLSTDINTDNLLIESSIMPEETKNKIRESVLKYYQENQEVRAVNIEKHREAMTKAVGRKIAQYNINGEVIKEYNSIREADRLSGIKKSNIQHVLSGKSKTAGGYIWSYVDEKELKDGVG